MREHFKKAHYNLEELKELIKDPVTRVITDTARKNAYNELGLVDDDEIVDQVLNLKSTDIYKTMTSHYNHKLWQDVYKPRVGGKELYIKLQKSPDGNGVVVQFKLSDD